MRINYINTLYNKEDTFENVSSIKFGVGANDEIGIEFASDGHEYFLKHDRILSIVDDSEPKLEPVVGVKTDNKDYILKLIGLYGGSDVCAYYREDHDGFNFAPERQFASVFTEEECENILKHKDFFCKQFMASDLIMEEV